MKFVAEDGSVGSNSASRLLEASSQLMGRCVLFIVVQRHKNGKVQVLIDAQIVI